MAREKLNVTVVVFANRTYNILRGELTAVGAGAPGARATDMLTLDRPNIEWAGLSRSMGVDACSVKDVEGLVSALKHSYATPGPTLIEVIL